MFFKGCVCVCVCVCVIFAFQQTAAGFVNKVVLLHSHAHLFRYCLWMLLG